MPLDPARKRRVFGDFDGRQAGAHGAGYTRIQGYFLCRGDGGPGFQQVRAQTYVCFRPEGGDVAEACGADADGVRLCLKPHVRCLRGALYMQPGVDLRSREVRKNLAQQGRVHVAQLRADVDLVRGDGAPTGQAGRAVAQGGFLPAGPVFAPCDVQWGVQPQLLLQKCALKAVDAHPLRGGRKEAARLNAGVRCRVVQPELEPEALPGAANISLDAVRMQLAIGRGREIDPHVRRRERIGPGRSAAQACLADGRSPGRDAASLCFEPGALHALAPGQVGPQVQFAAQVHAEDASRDAQVLAAEVRGAGEEQGTRVEVSGHGQRGPGELHQAAADAHVLARRRRGEVQVGGLARRGQPGLHG